MCRITAQNVSTRELLMQPTDSIKITWFWLVFDSCHAVKIFDSRSSRQINSQYFWRWNLVSIVDLPGTIQQCCTCGLFSCPAGKMLPINFFSCNLICPFKTIQFRIDRFKQWHLMQVNAGVIFALHLRWPWCWEFGIFLFFYSMLRWK